MARSGLERRLSLTIQTEPKVEWRYGGCHACMGRDMLFGDLDDPDREVSRLIERNDAKLDRPLFPAYFSQTFKPSVYYIEALRVNSR